MLHKNKLTLLFPFNDISALCNEGNVAALFSLPFKIGGFVAVCSTGLPCVSSTYEVVPSFCSLFCGPAGVGNVSCLLSRR